MREKLIEMIAQQQECGLTHNAKGRDFVTYNAELADHLIAGGVTIPVRCRECTHFTEGMAIGMCKRNPDKPILPVPYDHFCSFGKRRNDV